MSKSKPKSLSKKAMTDELMMVAKVAGGFVAGTALVNVVEKALKVDSSSKLPKRLIAPAAVAAAGAVVSIKGTNPTIKQVAAGIGAAGAVRTAKAMAPNATMLQGLGAPEDEHLGLTPISAIAQNEDWVYRDSSGHLAFPELGEVQPPQSNNGYFVDAPVYLGDSSTRDDLSLLGTGDGDGQML